MGGVRSGCVGVCVEQGRETCKCAKTIFQIALSHFKASERMPACLELLGLGWMRPRKAAHWTVHMDLKCASFHLTTYYLQ